MVRILRPEDQKSMEQFRAEQAQYTDEQSQKLGYPSTEVLLLSNRLGDIAATWRGTKRAELIVEYKHVLYEMILKGFDVNDLDIEDNLPPEHMPDLPPKQVIAGIKQGYMKAAAAVE